MPDVLIDLKNGKKEMFEVGQFSGSANVNVQKLIADNCLTLLRAYCRVIYIKNCDKLPRVIKSRARTIWEKEKKKTIDYTANSACCLSDEI